MTDTVLTELKIHEFDTVAQFLQHESEVGENDISFTPFMPANLYLFYHHWADHIVNDPSWLRADTFSWQSGDVYQSAYQHLVKDIATMYAWSDGSYNFYTLTDTPAVGDDVYFVNENYGTSKVLSVSNDTITFEQHRSGETTTATRNPSGNTNVLAYGLNESSDTIGDITITYYLAQDGHKICAPDQESNIVALYEATGVAWYYLLDTENKQFKLPRSKHNKYADTVHVVGNGNSLGTVNLGNSNVTNQHSVYSHSTNNGLNTLYSDQVSGDIGITTDPQKSGIIAQLEQDTDQYKYLYFYVGHFEQDSVEQTAGINTETFNGKADRNLMNTTDNVDIVIESQLPTASNGYTWYRKYKSGWVEQGGTLPSGSSSVTLPIAMEDSSYSVQIFYINNNSTSNVTFQRVSTNSQSTTGFTSPSSNSDRRWQLCGQSA